MTAAPPPRFVARTPEDLLALVPVVLGFVPQDSLAMLTFGAEGCFHARVDLPAGPGGVREVVATLLEPARRHGVPRAVFVVYTDDARLAARLARAVIGGFEASGIDVVDVLRADGRRWYDAVGCRPGVPAEGVPYDVSGHRFLAEAVLSGRVVHRSREELGALLESSPERVARVVAALAGLAALAGETVAGPGEELAAWQVVRRHLADGSPPSDADVAWLLRALLAPSLHELVWSTMERGDAADHVRLWTDVVARAPERLVAAPAALLAFAAWLAGDGALAWCAHDRCVEADPDCRLAALVAELLTRAVSPRVWEEPGEPDPADRSGRDASAPGPGDVAEDA